MSVGRERKDPAAAKSFSLDWSDDLATGDTIASSAWSFETDTGASTTALTNDADVHDTTTTTIKVSGGVEHATYYLKNTVVTANGDTLVRRLMLDVERE